MNSADELLHGEISLSLSMEHTIPWEADSLLADQGIKLLLKKTESSYRDYSSLHLDSLYSSPHHHTSVVHHL
jgi:hypothetical protein